MEYLVMLLDIYEEEVLMKHYIGDKIIGKDAVYLISKEFGFIERLVENDKVDFNFGFIYHTYDEDELGEKYSDLDSLIMILSIQDNPIEYLCKIIKE